MWIFQKFVDFFQTQMSHGIGPWIHLKMGVGKIFKEEKNLGFTKYLKQLKVSPNPDWTPLF